MARLARRVRIFRGFLLVLMAALVGVFVGLIVLGATQDDEPVAPPTLAVWTVGDSITFGSSSDGGSIPGGYRGTLETDSSRTG